jgi:hypothetical protein
MNPCKFLDVVSRKKFIAVSVVAFAMVTTLFAQSAPRADRITQSVNVTEVAKIVGSVPAAARRASDLGEVDSAMRLESMSLHIGLSAAQQTELDALLEAQQNPQSAQYHQWLTQEEYGERFGLTAADLSKVTGWLEAQGFVVKTVAPSRNLITFSGAVAQAELAFGTKIHQYREADGSTHIGNTAEISIPRALSGVVAGVHGLSGFRPKPRVVRRAKPDFTSSISGVHSLAPGDWATIYDVNAIYNAGYTGAGMHVMVAGETYFPLVDITNFRAAAGLSAPLVNMVCISAADCTDLAGEYVSDIGEADLDVEWAGGIAKDATVDYIYAAGDDPQLAVFDSLVYGITTYKVSGAVVPVIGVSYGDCEYDAASSGSSFGYNKSYSSYDNYLAQAAGQGQTILISSGDDGAGCSVNTTNYDIADHGASVSWPASSPYVIAVGGTTFSADGTAANPVTGSDPPYWSYSSSADIVTSALAYIPETTWNDSVYDGELSSSGGGVSIFYTTTPTWQTGLFSGQPSGRMVPDISFAASADHDPYLECSQNFPSNSPNTPVDNPGSTCVTGFRYSDDTLHLSYAGGTSASVQAFSGLLTLLVQANGKKGLGNINPKLYSLAANATTYKEVFNDIASGNNIVPCPSAKSGCTYYSTPPGVYTSSGYYVGYSAGTGYDMATGLGSIDGYALYKALGGSGLTASTTTLSAVPAAPSAGQSVTLTATVASGSSTVTSTPGGTVTFTIDGVVGNAITLSGGTASTVTSFSTAGTHTVAIAYGGDGTFAASSTSGTLTVAAAIATTTAVTASPSSILLGSSSATESFTATVTPSGGTLAGTVTLKVAGVTVGSVALTGGSATLSGVAPTTANGFTVGSDTVTASFVPATGSGFAASSGTQTFTVTAPAYTITPSSTSVSLSQGGSQAVTVTLASTTFAGTVSLTATTSSPLITASLSSGTATLAANGSSPVSLTITASSSAANHVPSMPWTGGLIAFGAVLAGVPLVRRRKRVAAVLLTALAISTLGFLMSCGGGSGSGTTSPTSPRSYTVTISGTGGITSTIAVTVQ